MKIKAFIYIVIAGMLWGTSGLFVNFLAPYGFSSLQLTAVRGTVSFVFILLFALITDRGAFKVGFGELIMFVMIGVCLFLTSFFYFTSMQMTSVSTAVVLMYAAPVYVMIVSVLFLGERFSRLKLVSVVLMLVGCVLVSGIIGGAKFNAFGVLWGVMSGISYAAYNVLTKIAMRRGSNPISANLYGFITMSAVALCVSKPYEIVGYAAKEPTVVIPALILLGIATFIVPYFLYTLSMKYLPAGTAASLGIIEPMSATVFSVIFLDEKLSVFSLMGIALILCAVFLLGMAEMSKNGGKQ